MTAFRITSAVPKSSEESLFARLAARLPAVSEIAETAKVLTVAATMTACLNVLF